MDSEDTDRKRVSWESEQVILKSKLHLENEPSWDSDFSDLKLIGGLDISYIKGNEVDAFVALVVLEYPSLEVLYQDCQPVQITEPYIPGFLAFREVEHCVSVLSKLSKEKPELYPQIVFIDGNGLLHPRKFGIAYRLGVIEDIVTIGCAKNLFQMDNILRDAGHQAQISSLKSPGDFFDIVDEKGDVLGAALKTVQKSTKPIYVSIGHKIDLPTACRLVTKCSKYREPEPTRLADIISREVIRNLSKESCDGKIKEEQTETETGQS
ncbi:endonuclease V-like [Convolutriloba macropyga]|uniref:endonuclease V-like n=1 Tax=Convolutriloba macropyga TaxID=536237 RepID=UPI003F52058F